MIFAYNKIDGTLTVVEKGTTKGYLIYGVREAMQAEGRKWNIGINVPEYNNIIICSIFVL